MKSRLFLTSALALSVAACATPPRFEFGAYEPTLYAYYKKPEMADKYGTALEKAIEKGEKSDRLAPGMYAELGYLRLRQGDQSAAIRMFESEAAAFPESAFFMKRVVDRLTGTAEEDGVSDQADAEAPAVSTSSEPTETASASGV